MFRANLICAGARPLHAERCRHDRLVLSAGMKLIFQRGFDVLKASHRICTGCLDPRPGLADRHTELIGQALGILTRHIKLADSRAITRLE